MRLDSNLTTALHKSFTYLLTYLLTYMNEMMSVDKEARACEVSDGEGVRRTRANDEIIDQVGRKTALYLGRL